jgi:hypothetical protein
MTSPHLPKADQLFDLRINVPTIVSVLCLLFGAAVGVAKMETRADHDADMQRIQSTFVRQDVNAVTDRELRDWQDSIKLLLKEHIESLDRIEKQLDSIERVEHEHQRRN